MSSSASSSGSSSPPPRQKNSGRRSYVLRSSVAPIFSTTRCINNVPVEVWREHICHKFLNLAELSILRRCHTDFEKYWQNVLTQNVIRVPQGCPTVEKAMALAVIFSGRKEYTKADPLKIRLDEGVHEIVGNGKVLNVTCSHITFVGNGKACTMIRGGLQVENQQNVTFEELTITNQSGNGLFLVGSDVDVLKCVSKSVGVLGWLPLNTSLMAPLSQQHNVNLWRMVNMGLFVVVPIQKQDLTIARCTTMDNMVCIHLFVLSWIFMVQKRTSIPTSVVFLQPIVPK
jgi:hypothetical protein